MEKEVVENFRSLTSRGSEVGGLLLGAIAPGAPGIVSIDEFELIECDYSRGPLYRLSDADISRFERAIEARRGSNLAVAGFFRSHTRKGLALDAEDVAFLEARFHDPLQVALLVRPYATKASVAGFFIWENGAMQAETSYLEFPFRSSQLSSFRPSPLLADVAPPPPAAPPASAAGAPQPAAPKAAARAQIVPIASRREINLPVTPPVTGQSAAEPIAAAPAAPPEVAAPAVEEPAPAKTETKKGDRKKGESKKAEETPAVETPKDLETPFDIEPVKEGKGKLGLIVALVAAVALVLVALFVYPGIMVKRGGIPVTGSQPSLSLRIEHTGADILLTWNRDSEVIRNAQRAVLSIFDGDRHENYDMDLGQLRNGSIVYSPITSDVSFRMDIYRVGKDPVSDSVRVLNNRQSPMGDAPQTPQTPQATNNKPGTPAATAAKPAQPQPATAEANPGDAEENKPSAAPKATKSFDMSSLSKRLRPATSNDLGDAPSITPRPGVGGGAASISGLNLNGSTASAPAGPAPAAPAATKSTASSSSPAAGGQIRSAELISRKEPEYPKLARQMGVKAVVVLTATIGVDGKVKSVKVEQGHPLLNQACINAVMQWVYKPTLLNGKPVQNDTRITLNFMGER